MRPATMDNGFEYYEYILVYIDDILVLSALPVPIMKSIQQAYCLKEDPKPPSNYLGATIKQWSIPSETRKFWSMNCTKYIKEAVRNIEMELNKTGHSLQGKPSTPMQAGY
jgi:hypothetical protein